jgi:hypothetical protein
LPNRIIKESICTSDNLDKLTPEAEVFFYRLMVTCDDYGIMFAAPSILRSKCYPWKIDKIKDKDIEKWRTELVESELIFLYTYDGKMYLKFTKWEEHQQVRATKSKYPTPDMEGVNLISNDINSNQSQANVPVIVIENRNRNRDKIIGEYTANENLKQTILDFMEMRNKIKKPMTDKAIGIMLKKLSELASTDEKKISVLEQSIANSWQGVFPLKEAGQTQQKNGFDNFQKRSESDPTYTDRIKEGIRRKQMEGWQS